MNNGFSSLGLSHELINAVTSLGYQQPSAVQQKAIPIILTGKDLLVIAQTGTGKTAAYTLPLLERLKRRSNHSTSPARHPLRLLILAPTRELAEQVGASLTEFLRHLPLKHAVIYGGTSITPQIDLLHQGVEIVVATIGRLLDILKHGALQLNKVEMVVLDEADKMLDIGFFDDINKLFAQLPKKRQTLLFSATFSAAIERLAQSFLHQATRVEIAPNNSTNISVEQYMFAVDSQQKDNLLYDILRKLQTQSLVFCNTKLKADRIARFLYKRQLNAVAIHSDKMQQVRTETLQKFKDAKIQILVSTDIAARGLDITALPTVINYDLPQQTEDYVHRIGRTGRAGSNGLAISLVDEKAEKRYQSIIQLTDQQLPLTAISHYEPKWLSPATNKNHASISQIKTIEQLRNCLHPYSKDNPSVFVATTTKKPRNQSLVEQVCFIRTRHKQAKQEDCALLLPNYGILQKY